MRIRLPHIDPTRVSEEIGDFVIDRVREAGATGCVIGLSGGVDSTTTAALIKRGFDRHNLANGTSYELVGYILPSSTNDLKDAEDGITVAQRLGIRYETHDLQPLLDAYDTTNNEAFKSRRDKGNLTSRIRGTVINTKGATERKIVAGTGNRDEDYGIGYYTLFGDGAVHINPIGGLSKRLVRQMAGHLGFTDLANREPTAGLEPGQTDFKDLGYKYDLVELVSEGLDQGFTPQELAHSEQIAPLVQEQRDLYARLYGKPRFDDASDVIKDIIERKRSASLKAEVVHPPTPAITLEYR